MCAFSTGGTFAIPWQDRNDDDHDDDDDDEDDDDDDESDNVPPRIVGQAEIRVPEDQSFTLSIDQLSIEDPDSEGLSLHIQPGEGYSLSGQTVVPQEDFHGQLNVPVQVTDGEAFSEIFLVSVIIESVNDRPVIVGQNPDPFPLNFNESVTLTLSHLQVDDPDHGPEALSLNVGGGDNYSVVGSTIQPVSGFSGQLAASVQVSDPFEASDVYLFRMVVAQNTGPVITGQVALSTPEETALTITLAHVTVEDNDSPPEALSLQVLSGENYTLSGNTITPNVDYNGPLSVPVTVTDGVATSAPFSLEVTVTPVNDAPQITGQEPISTEAGQPVSLAVTHFTIADPDNTYPGDFSLSILDGTGYSVNGLQVTPDAGSTGTLAVPVFVSDGNETSNVFEAAVVVTAAAGPPVITGQVPISVAEDNQVILSLDQLEVTDPRGVYPTGFSLIVSEGTSYTATGSTVTPAADFHGELTIPVQVSDGTFTSAVFNLTVTVTPVNDPPVITGQSPVSTDAGTPVTITLAHLTVTDVDNEYPAGFVLSVSPGAHYTASGAVVTPAPGFTGTLSVPVTVSDGAASSAPFDLKIQVAAVSTVPVVTGQLPLSTNEDEPVALALSHLVVESAGSAYPNGFSLLIGAGQNYTFSGNTITPTPDFAGVLSIPVRVTDGTVTSAPFNFQLEVLQVNDPPFFDPIADQTIGENTVAGSVTITGVSKGSGEGNQQLTFVATSGDVSVIETPVVAYSGTGTTATLSYGVVPNASGRVTITVVAIDNGSNTAPHRNSFSRSFQVEVVEVNASPTLDVIADFTVLEDAEVQQIRLTGIGPGAGESQQVTVSASAAQSDLFQVFEVVYTAPETTGLLRFKTKPDAFGKTSVTVTVTDDGPRGAGHVHEISRSFVLTVQGVNDPPAFTSQPVTLAVAGEPYLYEITASDADGERLNFSAVEKPDWASLKAAGNSGARFEGRPPASAAGSTTVVLRVSDGDEEALQEFSLHVNVLPSLSPLSSTTEEDVVLMFSLDFFVEGYEDANDDALASVRIAAVPEHGTLRLGDREVGEGETIDASSLGQLAYHPETEFSGEDSFVWLAGDGYHFSAETGVVTISVVPVNDPPELVTARDTLFYDVNGEYAFVVPDVEVFDPDSDTIQSAMVSFSQGEFRAQLDELVFQRTTNIRGEFDFQSGRLLLAGEAPIDEYQQALRSVRYLHRNTVDPDLTPRTLVFEASDEESTGPPLEMVIAFRYTFVDLVIPSGFTPNGDKANDTWVIDWPGGGIEEIANAVVSVYNAQGMLVFRARGFENPWDGTLNGELLPAGTYYYAIDLNLRNRKTYKGIVTILR